MDRATVRQKKTGQPVRFELSVQTRQAIDGYLRLKARRPGRFLFAGRGDRGGLTTRQYARFVQEWVASIGLDPAKFGTHSLRRTKAVLIYRRTGNLRAVQLMLGHTRIESTVRYLGIEVVDEIVSTSSSYPDARARHPCEYASCQACVTRRSQQQRRRESVCDCGRGVHDTGGLPQAWDGCSRSRIEEVRLVPIRTGSQR